MPESQVKASKPYDQGRVLDFLYVLQFALPKQIFWQKKTGNYGRFLHEDAAWNIYKGALGYNIFFLLYAFKYQLLIIRKMRTSQVNKILIFSL